MTAGSADENGHLMIEHGAVRPLDGPLQTPDEAAALQTVKTSWIYEAVRTGRLPCLRLGRHIRFTRGMLEEWLDLR